jgi:hypothetical protein
MIEQNDVIKKQVEYFYNNKFLVHIEKKNGRFYNGLILEHSGDLIILDDRVLGAIPIYFIEIQVMERGKEND